MIQYGTMIPDVIREFRRHQDLADRCLLGLSDEEFFRRPTPAVNPAALVVKHLAGNLVSRWTDFLTTDGDKPTRDRDGEFVLGTADTREALSAAWESGWTALFATLSSLKESDLDSVITILGEPHTVRQAVLRGLTHIAYHVGQILYIARMVRPDGQWLTIPPGQSQGRPGDYLGRGSVQPNL